MKSWNDPSPYGPSRCTVSGTTPQRSASDRYQAASSRLKRPRAKSHRGRSPRSGLYTASMVAPACVSSTRNVALELHGIRPLTVTSPRRRSRAASVDDVAIAPRADMAARVLGLVAPLADLPAGLHQLVRLLDEGRRLRPGDQQTHRGGVALLVLQELVGDDQDAIARLVVADGDRGDDPDRVDGLEQRRRLERGGADGRKLLEQAAQILGEGSDLLLLALERDERALLARLQIEHALAGRPDGAGSEVIGRDEFERRAHFPPSQPRSPSTEFTVSTTGPCRW